MKKNKLNKKGFAMAELLAVSVTILLLFSILFSNYLPLVAEYENRVSYTNVTANYGAFYVRKIYKEAIENHTLDGDALAAAIDSANNKFLPLYNSRDTETVNDGNLRISGDTLDKLKDIIDAYEIEELILTRYRLVDLKGPDGYMKSSGSLYNYINYLPSYKKSQVGVPGRVDETFRIILKTKEFGYATTQVLADPPTPYSCFRLYHEAGGWVVEKYHYNEDNGCGPNVSIPSIPITQNGIKDTIFAIGANAFETTDRNKRISSIYLPSNVKSIGNSAFKGNKISYFDFSTDAQGVIQVGKYAFEGNELTKIDIPANVSFKEGSFANNYKLKKISLEDTTMTTIPSKMFALDNTVAASDRLNSANDINCDIDLFIPNNIETIGTNAFKNIKFSDIEFEKFDEDDAPAESGTASSSITTIGEGAFEIEDGVIERALDNGANGVKDNYFSLIVPNSLKTIGKSAFKNVQIGQFNFENNSELKTIGESAFANKHINITNSTKQKFQICDDVVIEGISEHKCYYSRYLLIPHTVTNIGNNAFLGQKLNTVTFDSEINGNIKHSQLIKIGDEVFSGNNLTSITIPKSFANVTNGEGLGTKVFGDLTEDLELGNSKHPILVESANLITENGHINWCQALFGGSCSATPVTLDEDETDSNTISYKYTCTSSSCNGVDKYVSYNNEEA